MRKGDKLVYLLPSIVDISFLRFPIFFILYNSNWKRADLPNIFCTFRNLGRNSIFQSIRSGLRQNSNNLTLDSFKYKTKRIHRHLKNMLGVPYPVFARAYFVSSLDMDYWCSDLLAFGIKIHFSKYFWISVIKSVAEFSKWKSRMIFE